MKRAIRALVASAVVASALVLTVSASAKNQTICDGNLAAGSYHAVVVPAGAVCTSDGFVTINGGISIGPGATFVLGSEDNPVPTGRINGGVQATNALNVQIHFTTINGGIDIRGGAGPEGGPVGISWNTIEDSQINGGVTIDGYTGFWMGFIRNSVNGSVNLNNNTLVDPDGNEYVTNRINGNLNCAGNSPAPQVGDSEGSTNVVSGHKTGQCAGV